MSTARASVHRPSAVRRYGRALVALLLAVVVIVLLIDRVAFNNSTSPRATGSGIEATQVRSLPPFSALDLTGANHVTVHVGATQSVTVHADDNLIGRITTRVQSGSLLIGNTPGNFSTRAPTIVAVTVPSLGAITLTGYGNITGTGLNSQSLTVALAGYGNVRATGTAARLDVKMSGAGNAILGQL